MCTNFKAATSVKGVMAIFTIRLNKYFLDTFIEFVEDLTNLNDDKINDIDEIDDKIYLNLEDTKQTNQKELKHVVLEIIDQVI